MQKKKITSLFSFWFLIIASFSLIAYLVHNNQMGWFDKPIISFFQSIETPVSTKLYMFFTLIGSTPFVILIFLITCFLLYFVLKFRTQLIFFLLVLIGSTALNNILKNSFQRERPISHRLVEATGYSFPSGHSMAAFTLYFTLAFLIWKHLPTRFWRGIVIILTTLIILMIGTSRIYLGVHYPSDIIGGYLASTSWLILTIFFYQRYLEAKKDK